MTVRILHFADAHIDMVTQGRLDPATGLPVRVMDFLKSLDQIVERAISEKVDLVVFAGDAYKDRNPQPTYQREWGKRMMQLSKAGIPTLLLVGNHDVARASNRAHTMEEYRTLDVPNIFVADEIHLWTPEQLGVPVQIIAIPWVARSTLMTRQAVAGKSVVEIYAVIEEAISNAVKKLLADCDPDLPLIVTAHASVEGAKFGSERTVMLGHELVLTPGMLRDKLIDYVALGHIHQHQNLNPGLHPPIIYPGSIERIDFGEVRETKGFVLAEIDNGRADWQFVPLVTRRFLDFRPDTPVAETFMQDVMAQLPDADEIEGAVCRVQLSYPREWEPLVDESAIAERFELALSYQLQKHRTTQKRARLGDTADVEKLSPLELLDIYWRTTELDGEEAEKLQSLAREIFDELEQQPE